MTDQPERWRLAANTSDTPVLIDDEGHQLGGGEYGPADTTSAAVADALARGVLVYPEPPRKNAPTPAGRAQAAVHALNSQQSATDPKETR
jgi:hypothetical protein